MVAQAVTTGDMVKSWVAEKRPEFAYRTLAHLPSAHIAGIQGYFINPFYLGGHVYWMPKFNFAQFLDYNKKYRITFFFTVPPIYLLIAKSAEVTDQFQTLELASSGAAPLGKDLQHAASQKLGGLDFFIDQSWGLSETTGGMTIMPTGMHDDTWSVGPLMHPSICAAHEVLLYTVRLRMEPAFERRTSNSPPEERNLGHADFSTLWKNPSGIAASSVIS